MDDVHPIGNGFDRDLCERLLRDIDAADAQLASLKGEYMANCKEPRNDIAEVFKQAKDKGLPTRAFRALVKNRRLDRKMAANVDRLEADDQANYDALVAGLGEDFCNLPLGQAALRIRYQGRRAVVAGAVALNGDGSDFAVCARAGIKSAVNRAVGIEPNDPREVLVVEQSETAAKKNLSVVLDRDGPHRSVGCILYRRHPSGCRGRLRLAWSMAPHC